MAQKVLDLAARALSNLGGFLYTLKTILKVINFDEGGEISLQRYLSIQ